MATSAEAAVAAATLEAAAGVVEAVTSAAVRVVVEASQDGRSAVVRASAAATMASPSAARIFAAKIFAARISVVPASPVSRTKGAHFVPAQGMPIVAIGTAGRTGTVAETGAMATDVGGADTRAIMATDITTITPITAAITADGSMATPYGPAARIGGGDMKLVSIDHASPV